MVVSTTHSYRHAEAIMEKVYAQERQEILDVIASVNWAPMAKPKTRHRAGKVVATLDISQADTNVLFEKEFTNRGWVKHPRIVSQSRSRLEADFKKGPIQVEIQFGNMARWYTDVFKFLLSYAADDIEVGVLVVPMQDVAKRIDENVVYLERVVRELPHAKMARTIPVWVIGLGA